MSPPFVLHFLSALTTSRSPIGRLREALFQALAVRDRAAQRQAHVDTPANLAIDLLDTLLSGAEVGLEQIKLC